MSEHRLEGFDMLDRIRDLVFVSHANPEDNEFALWLTLQLANLGYPVWCDLTRLLGGEDFWSDIEAAIRGGTVKFVYVLSRDSNHRVGTLRELSTAASVARDLDLKDFVIPVRVDDLPFREINIELVRLNAIDFSVSWAAGLKRLVEKFELDGVEKDARFSPNAVADWWSGAGNPAQLVLNEPEEYVSNWFPIVKLPDVVYLHTVPPFAGLNEFRGLPFPFWSMGSLLISFADANGVDQYLMNGVKVGETIGLAPSSFVNGVDGRFSVDEVDARRAMVGILGKGWNSFVRSVGLYQHRMSGRQRAFYMPDGLVRRNRVDVVRNEGRDTWRQLVGRRSSNQGGAGEFRGGTGTSR